MEWHSTVGRLPTSTCAPVNVIPGQDTAKLRRSGTRRWCSMERWNEKRRLLLICHLVLSLFVFLHSRSLALDCPRQWICRGGEGAGRARLKLLSGISCAVIFYLHFCSFGWPSVPNVAPPFFFLFLPLLCGPQSPRLASPHSLFHRHPRAASEYSVWTHMYDLTTRWKIYIYIYTVSISKYFFLSPHDSTLHFSTLLYLFQCPPILFASCIHISYLIVHLSAPLRCHFSPATLPRAWVLDRDRQTPWKNTQHSGNDFYSLRSMLSYDWAAFGTRGVVTTS